MTNKDPSLAYETTDTLKNRELQRKNGYSDGLNGRPQGENDQFGLTSLALKGEYDAAYSAGHAKWREANPTPAIPRQPANLSDYVVPLITDTSEIPFDTQIILKQYDQDHLAIGIRHTGYDPDSVDLILGFNDHGYGFPVPISEIEGWYPVLRKDLPSRYRPRQRAFDTQDLLHRRLDLAQRIFEDYEFDESLNPVDVYSWEYENAGDEMVRKIRFEPIEGTSSEDREPFSAVFLVRFRDYKSEIISIDAYDRSGDAVGRLPSLLKERLAAAYKASHAYDYGYKVYQAERLSYPVATNTIERTLLLKKNPEDANEIPRVASLRVTFQESTNTIESIQAYDEHDEPLGRPTTSEA